MIAVGRREGDDTGRKSATIFVERGSIKFYDKIEAGASFSSDLLLARRKFRWCNFPLNFQRMDEYTLKEILVPVKETFSRCLAPRFVRRYSLSLPPLPSTSFFPFPSRRTTGPYDAMT